MGPVRSIRPSKRANNSAGKSFESKQQALSQKSGPSCILIFTWILVCMWIGLLIASWKAGLIDFSNVSKESTATVIEKVFSRAETALRSQHILSPIPTSTVATTTESSNSKKVTETSNSESKKVVETVSDDIHVVFSTDCGSFQDWQTLVLFHSAIVVGQKGRITRIASGCDEEKKKSLVELYQKLYPNFDVHFTPDFKKDEKTNRKYDFYNKPWGLKHWLENSETPIKDDTVIALLDPDMIFLRPLTAQVRGMENNLYDKKHNKPEDVPERVIEGHPVAQLYGLGAPWTNDGHKKFNRGKICGENSPCLTPNERFGAMHYSVGPPYLAVKKDFVRIAQSWTTFVPRVYEGYPYLLAEMYAYSMASAHEKLPHFQMEHYMISNTDAGGEGWPWIDALSDEEVCAPPVNGIFLPDKPLPTVMHFCQFYRAGEIGFGKRKLPRDIFSCESPLLVEPSSNLSVTDFRIRNEKKEKLAALQVKRNAFSICVIHRAINSALVDYKKQMCSGAPNLEKILNLNQV